MRGTDSNDVALRDVFVPTAHLVGAAEGRGLVQAQQVFGYTRLMVAAFGLGGGWEALDRAITYSTTRVQGGTPLSRKQGYTHKLIVPHAVRLETARAFVEATATRIDAGEGAGGALNTEGAIAKYLATEAGNAAAEAAIQAHGGYGYTREYLVEKIKRDVRITVIYEGTSEILEMTIARDRWQQHLKTQGGYYAQQAAAVTALGPVVGGDVAGLALNALAALLETGLLPPPDHAPLLRGYRFLRRLESRLRIVRDRSVDHLPESGPELLRLARRMGYSGAHAGEELLADYQRSTAEVRAAFLRVLAPATEGGLGAT